MSCRHCNKGRKPRKELKISGLSIDCKCAALLLPRERWNVFLPIVCRHAVQCAHQGWLVIFCHLFCIERIAETKPLFPSSMASGHPGYWSMTGTPWAFASRKTSPNPSKCVSVCLESKINASAFYRLVRVFHCLLIRAGVTGSSKCVIGNERTQTRNVFRIWESSPYVIPKR